ncbi:methyl-accepting chemotaxis protein [Fodinisporobacter ferrooxydans]|uniref:Methyl-accepting chemotaxis protein n=2 Tax=Fodinisporobacter ferrooxydans TaxID=2901836 RepID=A0ABY4CTJ1_9BACL|nr:methyl-accepting chemotaxis protein [Alicyclobacillaceae bacterium MYW30-H2]
MFVTGIIGIYSLTKMNANSSSMYNNQLIPIQQLENIRDNNNLMANDILQILQTSSIDTGRKQAFVADIKNKESENAKLVASIDKTKIDPIEKEQIKTYKSQMDQYQHASQLCIDFALKNQNEVASSYYNSLTDYRNLANRSLDMVINHRQEVAKSINQQNRSSFYLTLFGLIMVFVFCMILCAGIGIVIARSIQKPLQTIQILMNQAEQGDLTVQGDYQSSDEIGALTKSFNSMMSGIRGLMELVNENTLSLAATAEELQSGAEQTSRASEHIAKSIQEVASGSEIQFQSVEHTVHTVDAMSKEVHNMAESSEKMIQGATQASTVAIEGNEAIQKVIVQMNTIQKTVASSAITIKELGEKTRNIEQILDLIKEIANQTNLLSLNAAIEAARAGEHGRGFAVVADQVRKLAQESSNSAKQINESIAAIQTIIQKVVSSMEQGTKEVAIGIEVVQSAGFSFDKIKQTINGVTQQIQEVSASIHQITEGTEEVVKAVDIITETTLSNQSGTQNMSAATEEQLASMQEIANSSTSLSTMAMELELLVGKFKIQ